MRSVRLGADLEETVARAATLQGISVSELIRQAVGSRCEDILRNRLDLRLGDVVGAFHTGGRWSTLGDGEIAELMHLDSSRRRGSP